MPFYKQTSTDTNPSDAIKVFDSTNGIFLGIGDERLKMMLAFKIWMSEFVERYPGWPKDFWKFSPGFLNFFQVFRIFRISSRFF